MKRNETPTERAESILVVDDNQSYLSSAKRMLTDAGFNSVHTANTIAQTLERISAAPPVLILIDIHLNDADGDGISLAGSIRKGGYNGKIVIVSGDRSSGQFFRAARAGANDFLVKGPKVDLPLELTRMLDEKRGKPNGQYRPMVIGEMGYLRTFGLTPREIDILVAYAEDFPLQKILSDRVGKTDGQLRKTFSRIQAKLGVDNLAQLGHILTICALFERDN